jgi:chemotaxis protein CheD
MSQRVFVNLGEVYFGAGDLQVETLLGSCVAITFWHPVLHLGGLCHFLLPARRHQPCSDAELDCRYGEEALLHLLQEVRNRDTRVADYQVKVFGGGSILGLETSHVSVGQANADFALEILHRQQIQVSAQDIAGVGYRYLRFDLNNGDVWVRHGHVARQGLEKVVARTPLLLNEQAVTAAGRRQA